MAKNLANVWSIPPHLKQVAELALTVRGMKVANGWIDAEGGEAQFANYSNPGFQTLRCKIFDWAVRALGSQDR